MPRARVNRIGLKYGKLTVVKYAYAKQGRGDLTPVHYYECLCECGNTAVLRPCNLVSGNTKSCGCLRFGRKVKKEKRK